MVDPYGLVGQSINPPPFAYSPTYGYGMYQASDPAYQAAYAAFVAQSVGSSTGGPSSSFNPLDYSAAIQAMTINVAWALTLCELAAAPVKLPPVWKSITEPLADATR